MTAGLAGTGDLVATCCRTDYNVPVDNSVTVDGLKGLLAKNMEKGSKLFPPCPQG